MKTEQQIREKIIALQENLMYGRGQIREDIRFEIRTLQWVLNEQ